MFILVSYDVSTLDDGGAKRLRRVARLCKNYGQRVQFSVFECIVDPARWELLRQNLIDEINEETDSLRFYFLGSNWRNKVEHIGAKEGIDQEGLLLI